jgi:hypothetical protein
MATKEVRMHFLFFYYFFEFDLISLSLDYAAIFNSPDEQVGHCHEKCVFLVC